MPQMHDVKGLAVVIYAEALTTKQMRYHQLSRRVNNAAIMALLLNVTGRGFQKKYFTV
jgi:hypothetical protein